MTDNVPKLRFEGFTDDWQQRKLDEVVDFFSGLTYSPKDVVKNRRETLVLRSSNVQNGSIVDADNVYVSSQVVNSDNVQVGDIIVVVRNGSRSLIGKHGQIDKKMKNTVIGAFMTGIRSTNGTFINAILDTQQFNIEINKNLGATINQITTGAFKKMQFNFPNSKVEQQKIGQLFQTLDSRIIQQKNQIELFKRLKKGYLQKIFSQEVRFSGFTQDWKVKKLEEIFTKGGAGGTPTSTKKEFYKGKIPFLGISDISSSDGFIYDTKKHITQEALKNSSAWLVPSGAISLAMYASFGKVAILMTECATSQAFYNMVFDNNYTRDFIYQYLLYASENRKWNKLISMGTQANLNAKKVKKSKVLIPSHLDEQMLVGYFLQALDNQISQADEKLSRLIKLKKAYLQKMFL